MSHILQPQINDGIPEVQAEEILKSLGKVRIIDVRRPDEFNAELGHIQGAELMTLGPQLIQFLHDGDRNQEIVFVCRSG
ncbi:MAG: rhodanese-like domain-containing protein [Pseudobdellovibrionaceae bacterium]